MLKHDSHIPEGSSHMPDGSSHIPECSSHMPEDRFCHNETYFLY